MLTIAVERDDGSKAEHSADTREEIEAWLAGQGALPGATAVVRDDTGHEVAGKLREGSVLIWVA